MKREVRIKQVPDYFDGRRWHTKPQLLVAVESDAWMLVRNPDYPRGMPKVISRKDWEKLPVAESDAPQGHDLSGKEIGG